jgi:hypothetical protein
MNSFRNTSVEESWTKEGLKMDYASRVCSPNYPPFASTSFSRFSRQAIIVIIIEFQVSGVRIDSFLLNSFLLSCVPRFLRTAIDEKASIWNVEENGSVIVFRFAGVFD